MSEQIGKTEQAIEQVVVRKPYSAPELVVLKGGETEGKAGTYAFEIYSRAPS